LKGLTWINSISLRYLQLPAAIQSGTVKRLCNAYCQQSEIVIV